jgi:hypothetical protein
MKLSFHAPAAPLPALRRDFFAPATSTPSWRLTRRCSGVSANCRGASILLISLHFSLLSAFSLGWRELNVGTWIARLQSREYTLRATGWVWTVSGIQSLLSVYLLALWVLTYLARG